MPVVAVTVSETVLPVVYVWLWTPQRAENPTGKCRTPKIHRSELDPTLSYTSELCSPRALIPGASETLSPRGFLLPQASSPRPEENLRSRVSNTARTKGLGP